MKISIVSGGFDPIHIGHLQLMEDSRLLSDKLIVIINNDNWLIKKKDFCFMKEQDRLRLTKALKCVDDATLTKHKPNDEDVSVCNALRALKELFKKDKLIFCNGGDRKQDNVPEYDLCTQLGIEMAFNVGGGKIQSSSELVKNANSVNINYNSMQFN